MNTLRIQTIIDKEWAEVFKNRLVLFIVLALPLLLTVLPLAILAGAPGLTAPDGNISDLPPSMLRACGPLTPGECLQVYIVNQFLTLFMIMPLFIPITIAAYSVVGEKTTRSLEPLLATPITTEELLAGKGLAAVIPAVLATWLGFAIFVAGVLLLRAPPAVVLNLFSPTWLLAIFVVGPLISVLAVNFALIVSSRVNDPRVAEQISGVLVVPIIALVFAQLAGFIIVNLQLMFVAILLLLIIDVALVYVGARLFQRETILTRWK